MITKQAISTKEIDSIGGNYSKFYYRLRWAINEIDERLFNICHYLGLTESREMYLSLVLRETASAIEKTAKDEYIRRYREENQIEAEAKLPRGVHIKASNYYKEALSKYGAIFYNHCDYGIIKPFRGAIMLDKDEGLYIDKNEYRRIFYNLAKEQQNKKFEEQKRVCEALNLFFGGVPISYEELHRYFDFSKGIAQIRTEVLANKQYERLSLGSPVTGGAVLSSD